MKHLIFLLVFFISACDFSFKYTSTDTNTKIRSITTSDSVQTEERIKRAKIVAQNTLEIMTARAKDIQATEGFKVNWGRENTKDGKVKVFIECSFSGKSKQSQKSAVTALLDDCYDYIKTEFK